MEVIIKNKDILFLTVIPDNELESVEQNNEQVITDFEISKEDREKIYNGCILNPDLSITETEVYFEKVHNEKQANIRKQISETIIDFNGGQFKIRKKDFAPIIAQFMDLKENSIEPINVLDYYYTPISFTYQDFLDFKALVSATQSAIIDQHSS